MKGNVLFQEKCFFDGILRKKRYEGWIDVEKI
jgi:hypothetical protein